MSRRCLLITLPPGFWLQSVPWWWPLSGCHPLTLGLLVFWGWGGWREEDGGGGELPSSLLSVIVTKFRIAWGVKIFTYVMRPVWWTSLLGPRRVAELQKPKVWPSNELRYRKRHRHCSVKAHLANTISKGSRRNHLPLLPSPPSLPQLRTWHNLKWSW